MNATTGYVILAAIVLVVAALVSWRRRGPQRLPLIIYVIGVALVWAVILGVVWSLGNTALFQRFALVGWGFALGMLAMYIAVHVYRA